mmetsp:Transcript_49034/g.59161  ORF Transcript_49034/g.59161 Transcript_49034/m.59161 type:complete len:1148 (-) Transcript_49034:23-3466(-)|eukprot:CAMPEP_0194356594 /NCGR_PEP_ID=MMETSP0174-20130528/4205_1 /TAXON_ID=216777 /ORGANISM="Proboscia alata, Strain PI-D3" /LENGTH=1147 /DNA_ID=CAMNT_0039126249 /DNA_START=189 /DNA_END=3632 /DNA_ORIENTATION=-
MTMQKDLSKKLPPKFPIALQGPLFQRESYKITSKWKRRFVVLNLADGGSITCYDHPSYPKVVASPKKVKHRAKMEKEIVKASETLNEYSSLVFSHDEHANSFKTINRPTIMDSIEEKTDLVHKNETPSYQVKLPMQEKFSIAANVPWTLKNIPKSKRKFYIIVPYFNEEEINAAQTVLNIESITHDEISSSDEDDYDDEFSTSSSKTESTFTDASTDKTSKMQYFEFRCCEKDEKVLWLKIATKLGRICPSTPEVTKSSIFIREKSSRIRTEVGERVAEQLREASLRFDDIPTKMDEVEYKVEPAYPYQGIWMTKRELIEDMLWPSAEFHDLRVKSGGDRTNNEIGIIHMEVLECIGLSAQLDRCSKPDPFCYVVCGSHAFSTSIIHNCLSPKWLCKSRRACIIPIFHAYAQIFVGVFDFDGEKAKDDFAGRVVIDVSALRPGCEYDVVLPLRTSSFVYCRKPRGCIRVRFNLKWHNERYAVLSYPKSISAIKDRIEGKLPVTVQCADSKSFRNIAYTVHGKHLPGQFSMTIQRAKQREFMLFIQMTTVEMKRMVQRVRTWSSPYLSCILFVQWMRCVYWQSFAQVPCYMLTCIILLFLRNYSVYHLNPLCHWGYPGLSFEELLKSLLFGGSNGSQRYMKPLRVKHCSRERSSEADGSELPSNTELRVRYEILTRGEDKSSYRRYIPFGSRIFKRLGSFDKFSGDHMEFPFSDGHKYQKMKLHEVVSSKLSYSKINHHRRDAFFFQSLESISKNLLDHGDREYDEDEDDDSIQDDKNEDRLTHVAPANLIMSFYDNIDDDSSGLVPETVKLDFKSSFSHLNPSYPEQDAATIENGRGMKHTAESMHDKLQRLTCRMFDNRIFVWNSYHDAIYAPSPQASEWLSPSAPSNLRSENENKYIKQAEKKIDLHPSSLSPLKQALSEYFGPIMSTIEISLAIQRSLSNLIRWKDPYLSFWMLFVLVSLRMVLEYFPWRIFFGILGIYFLGPQNWFLRLWKQRCARKLQSEDTGKIDDETIVLTMNQTDEKTSKNHEIFGAAEGLITKRKKKNRIFSFFRRGHATRPENETKAQYDSLLSSSTHESKTEVDIDAPPLFQGTFHYPDLGEGKDKSKKNNSDVSPYKVFVPYSILRHNRFFDWPPEPMVSTVTVK